MSVINRQSAATKARALRKAQRDAARPYARRRHLGGRTFPALFVVFIAAIILLNIVAFVTGVAHYEVHGLGYSYSIDLGPIHYHYSRGYDFSDN